MKENDRKTIVVKLATNDDTKSLVLSNFGGNQGDPFHCDVQIRSGSFSFEGIFYFDNYSEFTSSVEQMAVELVGNASLKEDFNGQSIDLEVSKLGHVLVTGVIEQYSGQDQKLIFGFKTDQTCLAPFGKDLRKIMD